MTDENSRIRSRIRIRSRSRYSEVRIPGSRERIRNIASANVLHGDIHFTQASPIKNRDMAELQEHLATQLATQHRGTYSRPSLNHITTLMCQV